MSVEGLFLPLSCCVVVVLAAAALLESGIVAWYARGVLGSLYELAALRSRVCAAVATVASPFSWHYAYDGFEVVSVIDNLGLLFGVSSS